jgi:hypothetical protein
MLDDNAQAVDESDNELYNDSGSEGDDDGNLVYASGALTDVFFFSLPRMNLFVYILYMVIYNPSINIFFFCNFCLSPVRQL